MMSRLLYICASKSSDHMLAELGELIEDDINNIRLVCVAGPSSSGKTTFANRLRIELMSRGIRPIRISIDDYYKPKGEAPLGDDGKPDLESIEALDIEFFNQNMRARREDTRAKAISSPRPFRFHR